MTRVNFEAPIFVVLVLLSSAAVADPLFPLSEPLGKGCEAIPASQCGAGAANGGCLSCGRGAYNCTKCCDGCSRIEKPPYAYCACKKPPAPFPPPGGDSWQRYRVAGMDVISVTGGADKDQYGKVVVMLHGGGGSGEDWLGVYTQGWLGDLTGIKYVFPTSAISSHVWYESYKNGCGLKDDSRRVRRVSPRFLRGSAKPHRSEVTRKKSSWPVLAKARK